MNKFLAAAVAALGALALVVGVAAATPSGSDTLVTVGSSSTPFPQNKQNEPAVAVNPIDPSIAAAGVNEERDLEACNDRSDVTCPFTPGIGTSGVYFSDHERIAVEDASASPHFGNVYVCNAAFRSQEKHGLPEPIVLNSSADGGNTWITRQLSQSVNNNQISGRQDCAVNTDSDGNVYVFWDRIDPTTKTPAISMTR